MDRTPARIATTLLTIGLVSSASAAPKKGGALDNLRRPSWVATAKPAARPAPEAAPEPTPSPPPAEEEAPYRATFLGQPDDDLLSKLCDQPIKSLEPNPKGGTTIRFKAVLADGTRASVRLAQTLEEGYYRADIAGYWLARAFGLGNVAPACERSFTRAELTAAAAKGKPKWQQRLDKELRWSADGKSVLASIAFVPDGVVSGDLEQDLKVWRPLLVQTAKLAGGKHLLADAAEGSRTTSWDYLTANWDRWSGANTFRAGKDGPWLWLENAAGFGKYGAKAQRSNENRLHAVERFSRSFVGAVRAASDEDLRLILAPSNLTPRELDEFIARRKFFITWIDTLIAKHGEDNVLVFD
jgi:hypothetical protein